MNTNTIINILFISIFGILFTSNSWSQTTTQQYYDVTPGNGNGLRLWSSNEHKISLGNTTEYKYGPVTTYSQKSSIDAVAGRGWTWGSNNKEPVAALGNTGRLQTKSWIKSMSRTFYFGDVQYLYGDNKSAMYLRSNHNTISQLIFRDKQNVNYGRIYGSGNGAHFGLLDGDGNWSYHAAKDNYTGFRINNSEKMRINSNGKIGIGTNVDYSPVGYRLYVQGGVIAEKVKVALESTSDWADYVFDDNYDLMSLHDVGEFINTHKHLPNVPSAEEVVEGGINVAKMDAKLLEKIEELTLYMIEMDKTLSILKVENEELKQKLDEIK